VNLTRHTDYALRVLMYLAAEPARLATVAEIAAFYKVSRHHLVKVVQGLSEHGLVATSRGNGGGVRLAQSSSQISIGTVVRKMENHFNLVECFSLEGQHCALAGGCSLQGLLATATETFLRGLDKVTLAEVTSGNRPKIIAFQSA
jgi:Rrf2 family nitric oxide-sensitive transcriptional repressor